MSDATREVEEHFKKLKQMSELDYSEFSEEDGLADKLVKEKGDRDKLKATQLRKVFQEIKSLEREVKKKDEEADFTEHHRLLKLMPMLAYAVGRDLLPRGFYLLLKNHLLNKRILNKNKDFLRTAEFLEAVMAYHKYRSSSESKGGVS